jgi:hypothetical protein
LLTTNTNKKGASAAANDESNMLGFPDIFRKTIFQLRRIHEANQPTYIQILRGFNGLCCAGYGVEKYQTDESCFFG